MIHALTLAFALALPVQSGPVHADLHPAEADVYLELGDVGGLLTALDQAPILRFARDERLKGLFDSLGQSPNRSLKELVQLGLVAAMPDAKPDAWLGGLKTVSFSVVAVGPASDTTTGVALLAVADLAAPEQAKALHDALLARAEKHEPMTSTLAGVERLKYDATTTHDMWCTVVGSRLVVGGTGSNPDDFAARSGKKGAGVASQSTFQKQVAALDKTSGTPILWFALARPIVDVIRTVTPPEAGGQLGFLEQIPGDLNPLATPRVARMQLVNGRFVTEMISSEPSGAAAAAKPVAAAWLEPVPPSSMLLYASAFDGAAIAKRMRETLQQNEQSAASLAAIEQKLGYGPERVLARLGPAMTVFAAAPSGVGLPEIRAWVDCDDPAAFTTEFEALVVALGETLPGFEAKTKPYKVKKASAAPAGDPAAKVPDEKIEVPLTTLSLPPGMAPPMISLSPSFAPVGKKVVFALNSMGVKDELKRVHGGGEDAIVPGASPLAAHGFALPEDARSVLVMDWASLLASLVSITKAFSAMMPPDQMPFDLSKLPPSEMFAEYFKPTFHYSRTVPAGVYRRNEASFGPETWLGILGAAGIARAQQAMVAPPPAPEPAGAPGGGR